MAAFRRPAARPRMAGHGARALVAASLAAAFTMAGSCCGAVKRKVTHEGGCIHHDSEKSPRLIAWASESDGGRAAPDRARRIPGGRLPPKPGRTGQNPPA